MIERIDTVPIAGFYDRTGVKIKAALAMSAE